MKVEADVQGSPSLIVCTLSADVKQQFNSKTDGLVRKKKRKKKKRKKELQPPRRSDKGKGHGTSKKPPQIPNTIRGQELRESGDGRPRLPVLNKPTVSVAVKQH